MVEGKREAIETACTAAADRADQRQVLMADREPVRVGMVATQRIELPGPVVEGPIRRRHDGPPGWVTIHADILLISQSGRRASGDRSVGQASRDVTSALWG
jgi:hypothetical protein